VASVDPPYAVPWLRRRTDAWTLFGVATALAVLVLRAGPIADPDVFWHIRVGLYTLHGQRFPFPDPWTFNRSGVHWHSTAWLSELSLAALQAGAGLAGVVALRFCLTAAMLYGLAAVLWKTASGPIAAALFFLMALPTAGFIQERPQAASMLFALALGVWLRTALLDELEPRLRTLLFVTYAWALIHGLFVLVPGVLMLLAVGVLADHGRAGRQRAMRLVGKAAACAAVAALTPSGPRLLTAPFTVGRAASGLISEWEPTSFAISSTWGFAVVLIVLAATWSQRNDASPRRELVMVLAVTAFGLMAYRNAGPASVLLAPLAAHRLSLLVPWRSGITVPRFAVVLSLLCAIAVAAVHWTTQPVLDRSTPHNLATQLAHQLPGTRVLNDYNISGYLIYSGVDDRALSVDGRADLYGRAFLQRYKRFSAGERGWQSYVNELHVDVALLHSDEPLTQLLVSQAGWRTVATEDAWSLLVAPGHELLP
jgi:hypothetical protein